ncbi:hypothetical protein [Marinobacterium arenosum]|uniref:hypothetical protein n=1 Tax=Marinobacterium arenosum TaxID=2862496 RepID=UPI001C9557AC|nr:hypothetical protein [Marinobacterium arenosum]
MIDERTYHEGAGGKSECQPTGVDEEPDISSHQQQVFQQDWLEHGNPQPDKLELAVRELPSNGVSGLTR